MSKSKSPRCMEYVADMLEVILLLPLYIVAYFLSYTASTVVYAAKSGWHNSNARKM